MCNSEKTKAGLRSRAVFKIEKFIKKIIWSEPGMNVVI